MPTPTTPALNLPQYEAAAQAFALKTYGVTLDDLGLDLDHGAVAHHWKAWINPDTDDRDWHSPTAIVERVAEHYDLTPLDSLRY